MYDLTAPAERPHGPGQESPAPLDKPPPVIEAFCAASPLWARRRRRRLLYLPVPAKFAWALVVAVGWTGLSIWLSLPWLADIADRWGAAFAVLAVTFIAYVPGFMNAFMIISLWSDKRPPRRALNVYPGVTVLIACYNEEGGIRDTLVSLAAQDYPGELDLVVLNDGSTDRSSDVVAEALNAIDFGPRRHAEMMDFPQNAGKAAVLNQGLAKARHPLVVTLDGDCWLAPDAMANIVERMMSDPADTVAVAGAVLVKNSRHNLLTRTQEWDYFHGIAAVKRMQSMYHGTLVAQGAFSIYRRDALQSVGGWPACVGEDIVLSWAFLKAGHRIGYAEDALVFTDVPSSLLQFARQRKRWSRGLIEAFKAHGELLKSRRLITLFIWWNVCFLPIDLFYTFVFIPGLVLAMLGDFIIAGPMTLLVLPLAALWNVFIFRLQREMFRRQGLKVRQNKRGLVLYAIAYSLLMQPVCVWGYVDELLGARKRWETK